MRHVVFLEVGQGLQQLHQHPQHKAFWARGLTRLRTPGIHQSSEGAAHKRHHKAKRFCIGVAGGQEGPLG